MLPALVVSGLSVSAAHADPRIDDDTGPALTQATPPLPEEAAPSATEAAAPQSAAEGDPAATQSEATSQPSEEVASAVTQAVTPQPLEDAAPAATEAETTPQAAEEAAAAATQADAPQGADNRHCSAAHVQQRGVASWYGRHWRGRKTASGQRYDERLLTAASRSLPLPTKARVTNLENGRSVDVIVNDRGPYVGDRIIDLSARAAAVLGITQVGLAQVEITALPQQPAI